MTDHSPLEDDLRARFREYYAAVTAPPVIELERRVLGTDYGATSYTDLAQAHDLVQLLDLSEESLLLDLGSGAGWPGLFLADTAGCRAVLTDLPLEGLQAARERAAHGKISRCFFVVASGAALPLRDETFDAVTHSDVMC